MIHEDGIEVYLKPVGPDSDNVRFAEFPLENVQINGQPDSERNKQSVILARFGAFQVVIRIHDRFKMYGANCLHASFRAQSLPPSSESRNGKIIQWSVVNEQYFRNKAWWRSDGKNSNRPFIMDLCKQALDGKLDELRPENLKLGDNPEGTIAVSVSRSSAQWEDNGPGGVSINKSLYDPGDPTSKREYVEWSSKRLASDNGKPYFFEFRYRSHELVSVMQQVRSEQRPGQQKQTAIAVDLVEDDEFVIKREQDRLRREERSANYHGQQQHKATTASEGTDGTAPSKPSARNDKAPPKFCDCPNPAHKQSRPRPTPTPRSKLSKVPDITGVFASSALKSMDKDFTDGAFGDEYDLIEPAVVPICVDCKNLKVPKFKRSDFLRRWDRTVLPGRTSSEESSSPVSADMSDLEDNSDDMLSLARSAQETSRQENDGDQDLSTGNALLVGEDIVAPSSGTVADDLLRTADAESVGPASASTVDSSKKVDLPLGTSTVARVDETSPGTEQSRSTDLNGESCHAVNNVTFQKRPAEELVNPRPLKQHCTSIDLTVECADGLVLLKEEKIERIETKAFPRRREDEDDGDLQDKLEDIDRELEIKRLERQRAEIVRKQKQKQKQAALKRADAVKVKKEVIQIEDD